MKEIRTLEAHEIEVKVANAVKQDGASFLLYKDARCDMAILDEVFGVTGWQRKHVEIKGGLFCSILLWDEKTSTWIEKQDVGVPSSYESVKGESSDSFKRAGFNVGIGRELYTAPFVWIKLNSGETYEKNGKWQVSQRVSFSVSEIEYDEHRNISKLVIVDNKGNVRYTFGSSKKVSTPSATEKKSKPKQSKVDQKPKQQQETLPESTTADDGKKESLANKLVRLMMKAKNCDEEKAVKILLATYQKETGKDVSGVNFISKEWKQKFLEMLQ